MLDAFFLRALAAGLGVALIAGPLGCFIVWRRMAYFGDTMAHAGLLGVALSFLLEVNIMAGVFGVAVCAALALVLLQRQTLLPADALLGILAHSTLALGLVLLAFMAWLRVDLLSYLFGDILAVSWTDVTIVWAGGAAVLAVLLAIWRPLLAATVSPELAAAEGMNPERDRLAFMILLAAVIAVAIKIVGILLITSLLIIPAASARRLATGPEVMALVASALGCGAVALGLFASLEFDTPAGPSIVVAALLLFLATQLRLAARRGPT